MASVLSLGWKVDRRCGAGPGSERRKLRLCLVSKMEALARIALTLSSYDPEYEQWEFGKLSALREIAFSIEHQYPYYYMG